MIVWLAAEENAARPAPFPTLATSATMTTSPSRRRPYGINDGEDPRSSSEPGSSFDWWPRKGALEWIEMRFGKPTKVSDVQIYWFDDTGDGEVRVPASWRVLYSDGGSWKPVDAHDAYGLAKDQYNQVRFTAIVTSALRVEIQAQEEFSAGVQEVKVK
jgi:hypothetical protein